MPTYAILGATGRTGGSLLTLLLETNNTINIYVRSKSKIFASFPDLRVKKNVNIFEGSITNIPLIASCLKGTDAVFSTIGSNGNVPGIHVVEDTAHSIVAALCDLRNANPKAKIPRIIFLTSATINHHLCREMPAAAHWILLTALSNLYADLARAETYLHLHSSWLHTTFVQPGGLVEDSQKGHRLSTERQQTFLSYLDLAAGMIELAQSEGYEGKGVSVVPATEGTKIEWRVPFWMAQGLLYHFVPSAYWVAERMGF